MMSPASGNKDKVPGTPLIPPSLDEDCVYEGGEPPSHDSGIICQTPVAGKKDSVDAVVLSPMHPPRPLVHIREDQESDEDVGNENHPTDTAAAGGGEKGWVGRQVDALFSPVLNFLHGEEEDHGHHHLHPIPVLPFPLGSPPYSANPTSLLVANPLSLFSSLIK